MGTPTGGTGPGQIRTAITDESTKSYDDSGPGHVRTGITDKPTKSYGDSGPGEGGQSQANRTKYIASRRSVFDPVLTGASER